MKRVSVAFAAMSMAVVSIAVPVRVLTASASTSLTPATQVVSATVGVAITPTATYTSTGIVGTRVFAISPSLPAGLTLNTTTGVISGTPTAVTVSTTHTVTATDGSTSATASVTITVNGTASISPATQTVNGRVGVAITPTAVYSDMGLSVKYFAIAPALPAGLRLDSASGVLSGTPTEAKAAATYVVTAADGTSFANATIRITIEAALPGTVIAPTTTVPTAGSTSGCPTPTISGRSARTIDVPNSSLPLTQFACSIKVLVRPAPRAVVAIAHQGTAINRSVARYSVVLSRVNGGSLTRSVTMGATPGVLTLNYGPLIRGAWTLTVVALNADGATVGTYTTSSFQVG